MLLCVGIFEWKKGEIEFENGSRFDWFIYI